jgi:hypothetical protein
MDRTGATANFFPPPMDVVAHDNTDRIQDITQEEWQLVIEALGIAMACVEVEVENFQCHADAAADRLRDITVLKRKLEQA